MASLQARLEQICKLGTARVIFMRGKKSLEFGRFANVIDAARGPGVYDIALMTN